MAGCYKDWGGEHQISKKLLDEAEQWLLIFERAGLNSKDNVLAFDWESLHKKGLVIAIKLKQELEKKLVRALFSFDNGEIERISNLLKPR